MEVIREGAGPEAAEAPPEPTLVKGEATLPAANERVSVKILAPRNDTVLKRGPVRVKLGVTGWPVAPNGGYVTVVVDDRPPLRVTDPAQMVELSAENLGGSELEEGSHVVAAFATRASGESVKTPGAFAATVFHLGKRTERWRFDSSRPFLTPNLPSGTYEGDGAAAILLDFYVSNATLAEVDHRVRLEVGENALSGEITEWVPHYLNDLPDGTHRVVLTLVDAHGTTVPGPFGRVARTIEVRRGGPPPQGE